MDEFEKYLLARLHGARADNWLGGMEYYVVALTSQQLGLLVERGPVAQITDASEGERRNYCRIGYPILKNGPEALLEALDGLRTDRYVSMLGFSRDHKNFFDWLNRSTLGSDFEPIRKVVREYIFRNFAIPKGEMVLGVACPRRYLHTVATVSVAHRVTKKKMKARLLELGFGIKDPQSGQVVLPPVIDARVADKIAQEMKDMLDAKAAQRYLNMGTVAFEQLVEAGHIKADLKDNTAAKRYSKSKLDSFLNSMLEKSVLEEAAPPNCKTISRASLFAKCSMIEIVEKIARGDLKYLGRLKGKRGFGALIINGEELRASFEPEITGALLKSEVKTLLGLNDTTIKQLVVHGYLKTLPGRHPKSRHPVQFVKQNSIERFKAKFITLNSLAKERREHFHVTRKRLSECDVKPIIVGQNVNYIYHISEVVILR